MLSKTQAEALLNAHARWNVLIGATRSGKSYTQQLLIPCRIQERIPGLYILMAKTQGNVESNILSPMREMYGPGYVSQPYVRTGLLKAKVFGKEFICLGGDNIRAVDKLRGKTVGYLAGDEVPTWPDQLRQMMKTRLTDPRAKADLTGNPESTHHPFKTDFIDRAGELDIYHKTFLLDDNPALAEEIKEQLRNELTGVWHKRLILGLWCAAEGAIYDMLDPAVHVVDKLPDMVGYWVGCDYGTASVTCFWLLGLGIDGRLYFLDFWRWDAVERHRQKTDMELAEDMDAWLQKLKIIPKYIFIPDDAASFIQQVFQLRRQKRQKGQQTNLGIVMAADRAPGSVLDGIRDIASLLSIRRLLFARKVEQAGGLKDWVNYAWDEKAQKLGEDKPVKQFDHDADAGRYALRGIRNIYRQWTALTTVENNATQ